MSYPARRAYRKAFDTDAGASAVIEIPLAVGLYMVQQVYVVPDVVGAGATEYSTWIGHYVDADAKTAPDKYDPSIRFIDEARAVTAGTPSAPGRDPAEWVTKNPYSSDFYIATQKAPSTKDSGTGTIVIVIEFDGGTGHTGVVEIIGERTSTERIVV
jgi:hypothetical protein